MAAVADTSPLAKRDSLRLSDLEGCEIEAGGMHWFSKTARTDSSGFVLNTARELPCDLRVLHNACVFENKVCLLWPVGDPEALPDITLVSFESTYELAFGFVHVPDPPAPVAAFMAAVREVCKQAREKPLGPHSP